MKKIFLLCLFVFNVTLWYSKESGWELTGAKIYAQDWEFIDVDEYVDHLYDNGYTGDVNYYDTYEDYINNNPSDTYTYDDWVNDQPTNWYGNDDYYSTNTGYTYTGNGSSSSGNNASNTTFANTNPDWWEDFLSETEWDFDDIDNDYPDYTDDGWTDNGGYEDFVSHFNSTYGTSVTVNNGEFGSYTQNFNLNVVDITYNCQENSAGRTVGCSGSFIHKGVTYNFDPYNPDAAAIAAYSEKSGIDNLDPEAQARLYGLVVDQIFNGIIVNFDNIFLAAIELFISSETEARIIKKILDERAGIELSNDIPDELLAEGFSFRMEVVNTSTDSYRYPTIVEQEGWSQFLVNVAVGALDVYTIANPSKSTAFFAKTPGFAQTISRVIRKMPAAVIEGIRYEDNYFKNVLEPSIGPGQELQRRVSFTAINPANGKEVRAVLDFVKKTGTNSYEFIETKLRSSTQLTSKQQIVYDAIQNGTAKPVGDNAKSIFGVSAIGALFPAKQITRVNKYN